MAKKRKKVVNQISAQPQEAAPQKKSRVVIITVLALCVLLIVGITVALALAEPIDPHAGHDHAADEIPEEEFTSSDTDTPAEETADAHSETAHNHVDLPDGPIYADISVKDYGLITVELDASAAPMTVENFVYLAQNGFYDGLTFHRIMDGFMMQGGDPEGTGTGGSDTNVTGEFSANGYENNLSHTRGAISMARSSDFNSASSQFFIVQSDSTFLDGQYAAFGYVTEGMDYVDAICADAEPTDNNGTIPAEAQPVIESVVIRGL